MDKPEIAFTIPSKETEAEERNISIQSETNTKNEETKKDVNWRAKINDIFHPGWPYHLMWKNTFLVSCVIAISMDPLFLYVPYINEEKKCIQMDPKMKIVVLVYRCVTDIVYLIHILFHTRSMVKRQLRKAKNSGLINGEAAALFWRIPWSLILNFINDILAIIPLPQMIMLVFFAKLRESRYSSTRIVLNFLVISQYAPRILRVYLSWRKLGRIPSSITGVVWVSGAFNLFLYVTASHALGALWYFLAIEQETICWRHACKNHGGCFDTTFVCNDNTTPRNVTIFNEFCPINPPNETVYDFGIFLDGLQSGMQASTDFPKKFIHCFWWGLRNLSSFGQNLETRSHVSESLFAAFIAIIGLLLFLYLIGNLQTYMQLATTRWVKIRQKLKMKEPEIDLWISNNNFPMTRRPAVMQCILSCLEHDKDANVENILNSLSSDEKDRIKSDLTFDARETLWKLAVQESKKHEMQMKEKSASLWIKENLIPKNMERILLQHVLVRLEDNKDMDVKNLLSILPKEHGTILKKNLFLSMLKEVPMLQEDEEFEQCINYLKPVVYNENSYIIREGEPLDLMLFITQGIVWTFPTSRGVGTSGSNTANCLQKGDFFGEELLNWTLRSTSLNDMPISTTNLKCHTKVEAFALTANDLKNSVSTFWWNFINQLHHSPESELKRLVPLAHSAVKEARRRSQSKKPEYSPR